MFAVFRSVARSRRGHRYHDPGPVSDRGFSVVALCLLLVVATLAEASDGGISLAEAERRAVSRDADIIRLEAQREALIEGGIVAAELPDPRLRLGAVNVPTDSFSLDAEDMTMLEVGVSQTFPAGDTRQLSGLESRRRAAALEARIADRRRLVVRELRKAWIDAAAARDLGHVVERQVAWFEPLVENAVTRYGNGQLRQLDVLKATLEQARLRQTLLDLRAEQASADAMLRRWLDVPSSELATALPAPREWPSLALLESELAAHPSRTDFDRRIEASETGEELARQQYRPDWELDLAYGFRSGQNASGQSRSDMVSAMVKFSVPLFTGNRQDRAVAAARAQTRSLRALHDDHDRQLEAGLAATLDVATAAREIESLYDTRLLTLSQQAVDAAAAAYANDTADFAELIETSAALLELKLGRIDAAAQRARADADLAYLVEATP